MLKNVNNRTQKNTPHKSSHLAMIAGLFIALLACTQVIAKANKVENGEVDYFTDSAFSSAVATIQHPAGEYYDGVTYVAYQGPLEDAYIAAYEHATDKWSGPFKAGESILGKTPGAKIDNHGKPAMMIDDAGYIHLFFGGHGGLPRHGKNQLGDTHNGQQIHVVSKKPRDIAAWEVLDNIPPFGTYDQVVKMDNGDIYLFYRHGGHRSNWVYQVSTDNGRSFAAPVSILKTKLRTDTPGINDTWYAWFTKGEGDEIIAAINYHVCREDPSKHIGERHNGYYMVLDTKDHVWRNVKGEALNAPVTKEQADDMALVVDTGELWTVLGTATLDSAGNPHVTFNVGEGMGLHHGGPKQVNHYRWTGSDWATGGSTGLPVGVGDIRASSPTEVSLLLAHKNDGFGEVAWWNSTDGGQRFAKGEILIRHKKTGFAITSIIRNAHPDARVIVVGKTGGSDYHKAYLLGDNGPVKRPKDEADQLED